MFSKLRHTLEPVLTLLCGGFLVASLILGKTWPAYFAIGCGSFFAVRSAYETLSQRLIDVNLLMLLAAFGAIWLGRPLESGGLLFLFSLSNTLEEFAMGRTKSAIEGLVKLCPDKATLVAPEGDRVVRAAELVSGDVVRVKPFETVPVDGVLMSGTGSVDEAVMTGESIPATKTMGDKLFCGTQNLGEMLVMSVTSPLGQTTLDKVVELVENAQNHKASTERFSSWLGTRYTLFVIGSFALSLMVRLLLLRQEPHAAIYQSVILLVALSPCALVISTPATTLSALAWAARRGILVRGGLYIETAGQINTAMLDKTGTLTRGKPVLEEICVCKLEHVHANGPHCNKEDGCWERGGEMSDEARELLRLAAATEQYSSHPIASAIVEGARQHGIEVPEASEQTEIPGFGVSAVVDGKRVRTGQRRFFEREGVQLSADFEEHVAEMQSHGQTVVIVQVDDNLAAIGLRDVPRQSAKAVVDTLRSIGIDRIGILSGDTAKTVEAVAHNVGIQEYKGGLLPDEKATYIAELTNSKLNVMMVGDGINDAPSMGNATLGVAMGGVGSDIALNAADVVLMKDDLSSLVDLVLLGRRAVRIIRGNLMFAGGMIVALTLGALFTPLPLWLAVIGHEGSTVIVILSGLRLLRGHKNVLAAGGPNPRHSYS